MMPRILSRSPDCAAASSSSFTFCRLSPVSLSAWEESARIPFTFLRSLARESEAVESPFTVWFRLSEIPWALVVIPEMVDSS